MNGAWRMVHSYLTSRLLIGARIQLLRVGGCINININIYLYHFTVYNICVCLVLCSTLDTAHIFIYISSPPPLFYPFPSHCHLTY